MSHPTMDAARGKWKDILVHFGADPKWLANKEQPCPWCQGTNRYTFDDKTGDGNWYCRGCGGAGRGGAGNGIDFLMRLRSWDAKTAYREVDAVVGRFQAAPQRSPVQEEGRKLAYMKSVYRASRPVTATDPVGLYLARRCGAVLDLLGDVRYHPKLQHSTARTSHPTMVAMMGWDGKKYSGIHRTYLTMDGRKAEVDPVRMEFGTAGPVRLGPQAEEMGIAEGIETALSAHLIFGLPVWAGLNANGVKTWTPPAGVRKVWIFADNDASFVGQDAAMELVKRLVRMGLEWEVKIPPGVDYDWNDVWLKEGKVA